MRDNVVTEVSDGYDPGDTRLMEVERRCHRECEDGFMLIRVAVDDYRRETCPNPECCGGVEQLTIECQELAEGDKVLLTPEEFAAARVGGVPLWAAVIAAGGAR